MKGEIIMARSDILEKEKEIRQWINEEKSKRYICEQLHCKPETLNSYLEKMNIEYKGQPYKKGQNKNPRCYKPAIYYIDNHKYISSSVLRQKLIKDGLKENKCEICGISMWQGIKLPLELHHKNGNHFDNDLNNLQILCPNCHSIQNGNSGANIGKYAGLLEQVDNSSLDGEANRCEGPSPSSRTNHIQKKNYCCDCGKEICLKATRCKSCASKFRQNSKSPDREILKELIRTTPFVTIGKMYEVSDNAVRKWCKSYDLPYQSLKIKKISDEDWKNI